MVTNLTNTLPQLTETSQEEHGSDDYTEVINENDQTTSRQEEDLKAAIAETEKKNKHMTRQICTA